LADWGKRAGAKNTRPGVQAEVVKKGTAWAWATKKLQVTKGEKKKKTKMC